MKIHILTNDGSPLGVTLSDLHGENGRVGIGGAEAALMTLCEAWAKRGDEVTLYNNPLHPNDVFTQLPIAAFDPQADRDILIIFRSPNERCYGAKGKKVWFSTDQYTVGSFKDFSIMVDQIVTISPFHAEFFKNTYGIEGTTTIDLPVRTWEYDQFVERRPNQLIFCSVPNRGLDELAQAWDRIYQEVPDASLVITSDYRLWGNAYANNESFMFKFARKGDVRFLGAVKRSELVTYQLQSDIMAYPNNYDELFCISCAECQVAGAYPVTSDVGALATTNKGSLVRGHPSDNGWMNRFVDAISKVLSDRGALELARWNIQERARKRFGVETILEQWDKKVFSG